MATELFDNEFITSLTASITASQVTIPVQAVASAALQTAGGQFRIIVDAERMLVTAGASTTTWTVTRGIEGTGAATHASGAMVAHILTVGGFLNHHTIHEPGGADAFTNLNDTNFAAVAKDGLAARASLRTLGAGAQQAMPGNQLSLTPVQLGTSAPQATPAASIVNVGDSIEFGHTNLAGYRSHLGAQVGSGQPYLAFSAETGTTTNTFRTRGLAGSALRGDLAGGFKFSSIPNVNADSQVPVDLASLASNGALTVQNRILVPNIANKPVAQAADYTAVVGDVVLMTGAHVVTLPNAPTQDGAQVTVVAITAQTTVNRAGTDTITTSIQGQTTISVPPGTSVLFSYHSGVWYGLMSTGGGGTSLTPPARASGPTIANLTAGSWTKVPLGVKSFDPGGNFDTVTNYRYVAPAAGYYSVSASVAVGATAANQTINAAIYKNGTVISYGPQIESAVAGSIGSNVEDVIQLNVGDYLELFAFSGNALGFLGGTSGTVYNYMSVQQVGVFGASSPGQGIATQARAYRNAAYTYPTASTWTKIPLDTASFDPGSNFQLANNRYICPVTGYYEVEGEVFPISTASGQYSNAAIFKNGVVASQGTENNSTISGQGFVSSVSDIIFCQAGDYLELWAWVSASVTLAVNNYGNFLSVSQVGGSNIVGSLSPTTQTTDYSAGAGQSILMTGAHVVTLPNAPQAGSSEEIVAENGIVTVNRSGTDTITQGATTGLTTLSVASGKAATLRYLNGVWHVVAMVSLT